MTAAAAPMPQPIPAPATGTPCAKCGAVCEACARHLDMLNYHRDTLLIWLSQGAAAHLNAHEFYDAFRCAYDHIDSSPQMEIEWNLYERFIKRCDELRQANPVELERLINEWGAF